MSFLVMALSFAAAPAAARGEDPGLPVSMALGQDVERQERPGEAPQPVMEYVTRNSRFEAGALWTLWDGDLDLEEDVGVYVRGGVKFLHGLSVTLTYRHWDFESTELPVDEHVLIRGVLAGAGWRHDLTPELAVEVHGSLGLQRWESGLHAASDDTGPAASLEGGLSAGLHEALRARLGVALDVARTDFHQDSRETLASLTLLFGLELGW
jgi:hypothetical protein